MDTVHPRDDPASEGGRANARARAPTTRITACFHGGHSQVVIVDTQGVHSQTIGTSAGGDAHKAWALLS